MPTDIPSDAPKPRLCHLVKWPDFDGYGFNLHAEKSKLGQFIGKVDENSPAELAGLKEGDRIIEVNDVNISNENHKQVVERIKAIPNETKLLVLDAEADKYYKNKKGFVVKHTQPNVLHLKTPVPRPSSQPMKNDNDSLDGSQSSPTYRNGKLNGSLDSASENEERRSQASSSASDHDADKLSRNGSNLSTPPADRKEERTPSIGKASLSSSSPTTLTPPHTPTEMNKSTSEAVPAKGLNLNMTASEMRALLAQRKKHDPKKDSMDFRKKHAIIQEM